MAGAEEINMRWCFYLIWKIESLVGKIQFMISPNQKKMLALKQKDSGTKLEIGGGETPRLKQQQFINIDIRNIPEVDIVASISDLNKTMFPGTVSHIFSRHTLEHLASYEIDIAIRNLANISSEGTIIEIIVPNIRYHALQYLSAHFNSKNQKHALAGFNGWQRCYGENYWDTHKSSYDKNLLISTLSHHFNFKHHTFISKRYKHLHFIGVVQSVN